MLIMQFYCINDDVPDETTELLQTACTEQDVPYVEIGRSGNSSATAAN